MASVARAPIDSVQGVIQKILYVHPPLRLRRLPRLRADRDRRRALPVARRRGAGTASRASAAEVGVLFCTLVIADGADLGQGHLGTLVVLGPAPHGHAAALVRLPRLPAAAQLHGGQRAHRALRGGLRHRRPGRDPAQLLRDRARAAGARIHPENLERGSLGAGMGMPFALGALVLPSWRSLHLLARRIEVEALRAAVAERTMRAPKGAGEARELRDRRLRDRDRRGRRLPRPPRPRAATPDPGACAKRLVRPSSHGPARISRLTLRVAAGISEQPQVMVPVRSFGTSFPEIALETLLERRCFGRLRKSDRSRGCLLALWHPLAHRVASRCEALIEAILRRASSFGACHGYARFCGVCSAPGSRVRNRRRSRQTGHVRRTCGRCATRRHSVSQIGTVARGLATSALAWHAALGRTANNQLPPPNGSRRRSEVEDGQHEARRRLLREHGLRGLRQGRLPPEPRRHLLLPALPSARQGREGARASTPATRTSSRRSASSTTSIRSTASTARSRSCATRASGAATTSTRSSRR